MALFMGSSVRRANVTDDVTLELDGAYGLHALSLANSAAIYATGLIDDGLSAFLLFDDGTVLNFNNAPDDALFLLDGATKLTSATTASGTFLYVNSSVDSGVNVFQVAANGTLTGIQFVADTPALELAGGSGHMDVFVIGNRQFLAVAASADSGVQVFEIAADGMLSVAGSADDADNVAHLMVQATSVTSIEAGGSTYMVVSGFNENGLTIFEVGSNGTLTLADTVTDAENAMHELFQAIDVSSAIIGGNPYVFAAGRGDDGISVFSVANNGELTQVFSIDDASSFALRLRDVETVRPFELDGQTFLVANGQESALTIFHVDDNGQLSTVETIGDGGPANELLYGQDSAFVEQAGKPFLIGNGFLDDGFTVFELGGNDDTLIGAATDDVLLGLAGNDILDGGTGVDVMNGGLGNDTFMVDDAGDTSVESVGEGDDLVYAFADHTLGDNVEVLVQVGDQNIAGTGNSGVNYLYGNQAENTLDGGGNTDLMAGGAGGDVYMVDNSSDAVVEVANEGNDLVVASADYILAANVERLELTGGAVLGFGNDLDNALMGSSTANVLLGGGGTDYMLGGGGEDHFVIALENGTVDAIGDFEGAGVANGDLIAFDSNDFGMDGIVSQLSQTSFNVSRADGSNAQQFIITNLAPGNSGLLEGDDYYFA